MVFSANHSQNANVNLCIQVYYFVNQKLFTDFTRFCKMFTLFYLQPENLSHVTLLYIRC